MIKVIDSKQLQRLGIALKLRKYFSKKVLKFYFFFFFFFLKKSMPEKRKKCMKNRNDDYD